MVTRRKDETREEYLERARKRQTEYYFSSGRRTPGPIREQYLQAIRDYNKIRHAHLTPEEEKQRREKLQDAITLQYHGLTPEARQQILDAQGGGCAICGRPDERSRFGRLHVDHCHKTGRLRGLLCQRCNRGIGWLLDSAELAERAATYLREEGSWDQLRTSEKG